MRKKLLILVLILSYLGVYQGYSFFDGDLSVDIFKTIDDGLTASQTRMYKHEMTGQGQRTINDELNRVLRSQGLRECIADNLRLEDIERITSGDNDALRKVIRPECFTGEGNTIPVQTLASLRQNIATIAIIKQRRAAQKTQRIYEISRIGLYSDGDTTNSPFDLIDDIKEIEKIIFTQNIEYNGVIGDLDKKFDDYLAGVVTGSSSSSSSSSGGGTGTGSTGTGSWYTYKKYTPFTFLTQTGGYVCTDERTNVLTSGLTEETIKVLLNGTGSNTGSGKTGTGSGTGATGSGQIETLPTTGYAKINDNSLWPCSEFFCIRIEFVIKNYKLLTGGKTFSIESILKKSNEHMKKMAGTSGIQWSMTQNNFSLGTINLNLANMFHMGVQVTKQTPPILNIERKENRSDETEFTFRNMEEEYFRNAGLEARRGNNFDNFRRVPEELKTIEATEELPYVTVVTHSEAIARIRGTRELRNAHFSRAIDSRATVQDADIYLKEFIELEKFGQSFMEYINKVNAMVDNMLKIPIKE